MKRGEIKKKLLNALKKNIGNKTVQQICNDVGVHIQTFFYYFGKHSDFRRAVLKMRLELLDKEVE